MTKIRDQPVPGLALDEDVVRFQIEMDAGMSSPIGIARPIVVPMHLLESIADTE